MKLYVKTLKINKTFQSMSCKASCLDNSIMKKFFGILKKEMYCGSTFYSFDEFKRAIENYIDYYNNK